ncbi:MAG TPA: hypothetical protein VN812_10570 [Candidatus Acidoferrales bacterium]|nr:hypothetical protein [Candidatus Acidoferrales bacterium]
MMQWRACIRAITPAALALFVALTAIPRAGLIYHVHAGGEHFHVHAEDLEAAAHEHYDHDAGDPHHHHHHAHHDRTHLAGCTANGPVIEAADGDGTGHWHSQNFFQRAVSPGVFAAQHAESVQVVQGSPEPAPVDRPALPIRVRGPPRTA